MPRKIDIITEMYSRTLTDLTKNAKSWKAFLGTAAFQYKYPFKDQVLIFAQRPMATACVELETWNNRFGRFVNKGSHGIALIRESAGRLSLTHVFDVKDTHPTNRGHDNFRLWELTSGADNDVKTSLENSFGTLAERRSIVDAVISAAGNICEDNITDYLGSLSQSVEGSLLDGFDEDNLDVRLRNVLNASVSFTVLTRLGFKADEYIDNDLFDGVYEFNTPATINCLGAATGDISEVCLRDIERTVKAYEKAKKEIRTFENHPEVEYNNGENKIRNGGNENENKRHDDLGLQSTGRGDDSRPETAGTERPAPREVRDDASGLSENAPQGDLHNTGERSETDGASVRDRTDGEEAAFGEYIPTGDEPWGNGGIEGERPDEVGSNDEQHQELGGGRNSEQPDLHLKIGKPGCDPDIIAEALRHDEHLKAKKGEIVSFLRSEPDDQKKNEYVKKLYQMECFTEFFMPGMEKHIGYYAKDEGLLIYDGAYMSNTAETVLSWDLTRSLIEALIKDGNYLDKPKAGEQMTLNNMEREPVTKPISEPEYPPVPIKRLAVSQEVIDSFLRLGGCTKNSNYRIYGYYLRANNPEENVNYLKAEYETDAVGIIVNGQKAAVSWDENGVTFAQGESVYKAWNTLKMSWAEIDNRIRELIELGQYVGQSEVETAITAYDNSVGTKITYIMRDFFRDKDIPFKPEGNLSWEDEYKHYVKVLKDPAKAEQFAEAFTKAVDEMTEKPRRVPAYTPQFTAMLVNSYLRDPRDFSAKENILPPEHFFAQDQIDNALIHSGSSVSEGKFRIYSFFLMHRDAQERARFLSNEYGIGGSSGMRGGDNHDSKGLALMGGLDGISSKEMLLNWTQVAKRIDELIRKDRYMNEKEVAYLDTYEKEQVARAISGFYMDKGDEVARPFDRHENAYFEDRTEELVSQIEGRERLDEIIEMMQSAFDSEMPGVSHYDYDKQALETVKKFAAGSFNLFPGARSRKTPMAPFVADLHGDSEEKSENEAQTEDVDMYEYGYNLPLGTTVHLGKDEFDIISISKETVELFDGTLLPMELPFEQFMRRIKENPLNDHLKVATILQEEKQEENEPAPVGRIDFLGSDGKVGESIEYTDAEKFVADIKKENYFGAPMNIKVYRDGEGKHIPTDFAEDFDPPVQGFEIIDAPGVIREEVKYDLEYGYLGNGLTVYNKAVEEHGDYQTVAHIDDNGDVKFYVDIPEDVKAGIQKVAEAEAMKHAKIPVMQAVKPKVKVPVFNDHPETPDDQKRNFRIEDDRIGVGTPSERFANNKLAIETLKRLEESHSLASVEEQRILSRYVGWGGLADCFDEKNSHYEELKNLLDEDEYNAARESTLTAFYTPPTVIRAMYKALENMGLRRGNILEPSCGVGNFIGMKPDMMDAAKVYGVELDSISGRIAKQLYQKSSITVSGFEETQYPDSFFDVAIGNVPFGQFKVSDKKYDKHNFLIHDYFFAKALDKVRPGGVVAFITSHGTLDKENPAVRKYIAQRADLLGAIRLPNDAFKQAAGTEVTSDIIFLQKRDRLVDIEPDWVHLGTDENGITMNQYFIDNPDMIMGEMVMRSGPFGQEPTCQPYDDQDLGELLSEAVSNIHAEIAEVEAEELEEADDGVIPADPTVKNYSYTNYNGKLYYRRNSVMTPVDTSITGNNRINGLIAIRDTVRALIDAQVNDYPEEEIKRLQAKLNRVYDEFTKRYGLINSRANESVFSEDSSYFLLSSLEELDEDKNLKRKADMFYKRTIKPYTAVDKVDTASEALAVSLSERAHVDLDYMSELTGLSTEQLVKDLEGVIFLNPEAVSENDFRFRYLTADEYLSGNVREKLDLARRSAALYPEDYAQNVTALEAVQPVDLNASEIGVKLGSTWVPAEIVQQFVYELLQTPRWAQWKVMVKYVPATSQWIVTEKAYDRTNIRATSVYGTARANAYNIIEDTLNLKAVRIYDYFEDADGNKKQVLNKKETTIAQGKQEEIKRLFEEWIWKDPERRDELCKLYNENFNSIRPREYDGSHIKYYGMNPEITLRKHQSDAVARIMYGGNSLLAHVVGAGKTFTMVAAAQEMKRLGLCSKSMIVVPNHLVEQWASEYLQLYPSANLLVTTKKDFETKNRKKFCARIATGDYDAVIIGHSQFEKIPVSLERQKRVLEGEIEEITASISELKYERGERITVKQLEKARKQLQTRLDKLNDQSRKDDVVCFEELGVDRLFVDEEHFYKNLFVFSKMQNVAGISQTEAQKSSDLYMKCRYLDELTGKKGVIFATGTPISNSMVELFTMQRYLQYSELKERGLSAFDAWASTFGETVTAIELSPEGYNLIGR